jgi:PAS domain S-box-containing protein
MPDNKNFTEVQALLIALQEENRKLKEEIVALSEAKLLLTTNFNENSECVGENRESQGRYLGVFESSLLGNKIIAADLKILQVNQAMVELLGFETKHDLLGKHIMDFAHPDFKADWQLLQQRLWNHKVPSFSVETCLVRRDGSIIWVNVTSILFIENGESLGYTLIENIQARKEATDLLQVSEKQFVSMTDMIPNQVWTTTGNGRISYVNRQVCEFFGCEAKELIGYGWHRFIHPDDLSKCVTAWHHAIVSRKEYVTELRFRRNDGLYKWHLNRAIPIVDKDAIAMWLGTSTDIDSQKNMEHQKDEFLNIASHELKTPLTTIKAYNQIIKRSDDPVKIKALVEKSIFPIKQLERLIADLLDVTMINSGRAVYTVGEFDFQEVIKQSIESVQYLSPEHNIILESSSQVLIKGDRLRLEQVLSNVLTNSVKYSPNSSRIIVKQKVDGGSLILSVRDFGIGIAAKDLDHLFDRYYRVEKTAIHFNGLGLGLFISGEIIKRHQGRIWIESELGKGTTVHFSLPL